MVHSTRTRWLRNVLLYTRLVAADTPCSALSSSLANGISTLESAVYAPSPNSFSYATNTNDQWCGLYREKRNGRGVPRGVKEGVHIEMHWSLRCGPAPEGNSCDGCGRCDRQQ